MSSSETAPKKSKIVSHGRALQEVCHIFFAVKLDEYLNNIQKLLDTLSDLSVAKAYYSTFLGGHHGCSCFRCKLQQMCFKTLVKRGVHETFLYREIYCKNRFQEVEETYPFSDLYFEQSQKWCDVVYRGIFLLIFE